MAKVTQRIRDWQETVRVAKRWSSDNFEPAFEKNTAFNKNFGTIAGTVAEGNHVHGSETINIALDEISDVEAVTVNSNQFLRFDTVTSNWVNTPEFYIDVDGNLVFDGNIVATGEIQAYSNIGQLPDTIWESMPYATSTTVGGVQVLQSTTIYENGIRLNTTSKKLEIDPLYSNSADWSNITNKPSTATRWPVFTEVTSKPDTATRWPTWTEITNKPTTFPPSVHTHAIADVTNLQTELDSKLAITAFNQMFELLNDGTTDYIQAKYDLFGSGDIVAYSSADASVEPIWSSMPYATSTEIGGVQVIQSTTTYENGIRLNSTSNKLEIDPTYSDSFDETSNYTPSGIWDFTGTLNYGGVEVSKSNHNHDSIYHPLGGASDQNFTVNDLIIHGTVNHWVGDVITVDDARLQLNRTQDGATVASGIDIWNGTSVVSSLLYNTAGRWQIGGVNIATETWVTETATASNAAELGGVLAANYLRSDESDTMNGTITFNNGGNSGLLRGSDSQRMLIGGGSNWSGNNGAYISIEGNDFGGTGLGGNITFSPPSGKIAKIHGAQIYTDNYHPQADNADKLGGVLAANYLRSDESDTMSGRLTISGNFGTSGSGMLALNSSAFNGSTSQGPHIFGKQNGSALWWLGSFDASSYGNNFNLNATYGMNLRAGGSTRISILSGGNVLIGKTTDSGEKLQVAGNGLFSGNVTAINSVTADLIDSRIYRNEQQTTYTYKWGGSTDTSWRRIATLKHTNNTVSYKGINGNVVIWDENGNYGNGVPSKYTYSFSLTAMGGSASIADIIKTGGSYDIDKFVRIIKIGVNNYEVQVKQQYSYRLMGTELTLFSNGTSSSVIEETVTDTTSTGTEVAVGGHLNEYFGDVYTNGDIYADGNLTATGNVTAPNFIGTATNADKLDNIDSSQFLRSDVEDFKTAAIKYYTTSTNVYSSMEGRNDGDTILIHKWRRHSTGYAIYKEAWYNGSTYKNIGLNTSGFFFEDNLVASGNVVASGALTANTGLNVNVATAGDGGWVNGIRIVSTSSTTGEAAISFKNASTGSNNWIAGLNQSNVFQFGYGGTFNNANTKVSIDTNGNFVATGEVTAYSTSDNRLKENIKSYDNALSLINQFRPVVFNWNDTAKKLNLNKDERQNYGLVAQELEAICPSLVHPIYNGKYKAIDYPQIININSRGIQEVDSKVQVLERIVQELKQEIEGLKNK